MPSSYLSIIVPVYNEEKTIVEIIGRIVRAQPNAQIIYVNDGSTDRSLEFLKENVRENDLVLTKENGGKGSAIREAMEHVNGEFVVIQDADLEYDPAEIGTLVREAERNDDCIVFGSRFLKDNPNQYKRYLWGNKALTFALNMLFNGSLTDSYTCYKLFPMERLKSFPLRAMGFEIEAELCAYTLKRCIPIHEVPISYTPRSLEEGKKIKFIDALKGIMTMCSIRIAP